MIRAKRVFQSLIAQTNTSNGLFCYLEGQRVPIDASDLLRWEWVLAVSALDKYIHDIVRIGMVEEFLGNRTKTSKYKSFRIEMEKYNSIQTSAAPEIEFENEIVRQHSYQAFQHPEKLADALSYIWAEQHKWAVISRNMATSISEADLKTKLNNIIIRRDQIVHEGDCFTANLPLQQQAISKADADEVVRFITELVNAIHSAVV